MDPASLQFGQRPVGQAETVDAAAFHAAGGPDQLSGSGTSGSASAGCFLCEQPLLVLCQLFHDLRGAADAQVADLHQALFILSGKGQYIPDGPAAAPAQTVIGSDRQAQFFQGCIRKGPACIHIQLAAARFQGLYFAAAEPAAGSGISFPDVQVLDIVHIRRLHPYLYRLQ